MIKENVLRKNLLTSEIDYGNVDSEFEQENLNGNIIETHPYIEINENDIGHTANQLQQAREERKIEITKQRIDITENGIVEYNGKTYSNSPNARIAILNYILTLTSTQTGWYLTYPDKTPIELTKTDFKNIQTSIQSNEVNYRQKEEVAINLIDNAYSMEDINNIYL